MEKGLGPNDGNDIIELVNRKRKEPGEIINLANYMNKNSDPRSSIDLIKEKNNKQKKQKNKRNLKNKPKKFPLKRWIAVGLVILTASGIGIGIKESKEYKETAYSESLNAVKGELSKQMDVLPNEIQIKDASTLKSSNSGIIKYEVVADGKTYTYRASLNDGDAIQVLEDTIENPNVNAAISTVAAVQNNPNIVEAVRAHKLVSDINKGKIDLTIGDEKTTEETKKETAEKTVEETEEPTR